MKNIISLVAAGLMFVSTSSAQWIHIASDGDFGEKSENFIGVETTDVTGDCILKQAFVFFKAENGLNYFVVGGGATIDSPAKFKITTDTDGVFVTKTFYAVAFNGSNLCRASTSEDILNFIKDADRVRLIIDSDNQFRDKVTVVFTMEGFKEVLPMLK